jgi:hypothetical protein
MARLAVVASIPAANAVTARRKKVVRIIGVVS